MTGTLCRLSWTGYSRFHHGSHGILVELLQFVPPEVPIKISRLTLQNASGRSRRLSVTAYAEWVLGLRSDSAPYIITEIDRRPVRSLRVVRWAASSEGIAFVDLAGKQTSWTGDRTEFLGRNRTPSVPWRWNGRWLSGKVGAGLDPVARCSSRLSWNRTNVRRLSGFLARQREGNRRVCCSTAIAAPT